VGRGRGAGNALCARRVPEALEGRAAIEKQYGPLPAAFTGMRFPCAAWSPPTSRAWYCRVRRQHRPQGGGRYDNRYVGVFAFNPDGKLARYTEYFDPYTLIHGFPGRPRRRCPTPSASSG
jgi:ketosteroid isomerase-like protein